MRAEPLKRFTAVLAAAVIVFCGCAQKPLSALSAEELQKERGAVPEIGLYNKLQDIRLITYDVIGDSPGVDPPDPSDGMDGCGFVAIPKSEWTLVLRSWNTFDISAYIPNGYITFWVKGSKGGEDFGIGIQDCNRDRHGEEKSIYVWKKVSEYAAVTSDWQKITIPLADFFDGTGLDSSCIWTVKIGRANGAVNISNLRITSPDKEPSVPSVKVNQLGYRNKGEKTAVVSGFYEDLNCSENTAFNVINAESGKSVYSGRLTLADGYDSRYSGETVYIADFTKLKTDGEYYITVDCEGIERSAKFRIGSGLYNELLCITGKYYYYQRANFALDEEHAGVYARESLHNEDFALGFLSDSSKTKDVSGGWFDAGDFGKYIDTGATSVADLLLAYISFPEAFRDGMENIPESGNGIPDILDEVKYELDYFLKMQDSDGGIYHRVHPDDGTRAIVDSFKDGDGGNIKSTGTTANACAAFALASAVYKDFDGEYAQSLKKAARGCWEYIKENPGISSTGPYSNAETEHQTFYAACALYYAEGLPEYHDYIKSNYQKYGDGFSTTQFGHSSDSMKKIAYALYLASSDCDNEIKAWIKRRYEPWKEHTLDTSGGNAWNTPLPEWGIWWGSNSHALETGMEIYLIDRYLGENTSEAEALCEKVLNFILGENPIGRCMVTGVGEKPIKRTYSGIFGTDGIEEFPAGYTSGGFNSLDASLVSRFPLKCFTDTALDWVSNENSIFYQSALIFSIALQADKG